MDNSRELGKILFELYETFHPIKPHDCLWIRLSLENIYHNLFSDLDLEHPDRFYHDFSIWTVSHYIYGFSQKIRMDEFPSKTVCVTPRKMKISEKFLDDFSMICE